MSTSAIHLGFEPNTVESFLDWYDSVCSYGSPCLKASEILTDMSTMIDDAVSSDGKITPKGWEFLRGIFWQWSNHGPERPVNIPPLGDSFRRGVYYIANMG
jgi:hypothetical protein